MLYGTATFVMWVTEDDQRSSVQSFSPVTLTLGGVNNARKWLTE
jgi:hypothetical protein